MNIILFSLLGPSSLCRKGGGGKQGVKIEDDDVSITCQEPHGEKRVDANGKKPAHGEEAVILLCLFDCYH